MASVIHRIARYAVLACFVLAGCSKFTRPTAPDASGESVRHPAPAAAGEGASDDSRATTLQAHTFVPRSNNPYFPLVPGTTFRYRSKTDEGVETEVFTVTRETRQVQGVTVLVVKDVVRLNGEVIERTEDFFAMDELGNVWYFGEDSQSIDPETGEVSTEGSWEAGRNGAEAGIIMKASPQPGDTYNEENAPGVAQDQARIVALDANAKVPAGRFESCLHTENFTPLDPGAVENKFYAPGIGLVLEIAEDGTTRNELVSVRRSGSGDGDEDGERRGRHGGGEGGDGGDD